MNHQSYIPRLIEGRLIEALSDTPVILVHGPRQSGKTTLAQKVGGKAGYTYFSFDDPTVLEAAKEDPRGFIHGLPDQVILDEVQRVPDLFAAIKLAVDRNRKPGRFILTGSANILLVPKLADSLAGRMEVLHLHPLSRCEIEGRDSGFLNKIFSGSKLPARTNVLGKELANILVAGGYPSALERKNPKRQAAWYRDYINAIAQRDIRDLARIRDFEAIPRLLKMAALQSSQLFNLSELASPFQLSRPTIGEYVTLLERVFLIKRLQPWHSNRISRLIKTPKIHLGDTGLACSLLGFDPRGLLADRQTMGQLLETFVFQELCRQSSWNDSPVRFHHFRHKDGAEVDLVLERGGHQLAGLEVKLSSTVVGKDFRGLRKLQEATGNRFKAGVVLYNGEDAVKFGEKLLALPLLSLWDWK